MAVQINPGVSRFHIGTEGAGDPGPFEWHGRLFALTMHRPLGGAPHTIQVWYSEDDGATWAEADSANHPGGIPTSYSVGVTGCTVEATIYVVYPYSEPTRSTIIAAATRAFDMDSLEWGRDMRHAATTPHLEPNFDLYDCNNGVVPLPGERLRLLHLNDTLVDPGVPPLSYGVRFTDLDLTSGQWGGQTIVDNTPDGEAFPSSIVAGSEGRTHLFYKDATSAGLGGQRGMHRTVNADGSMEAEQVLVPSPDFSWISKYGFGTACSVYDPVSGAVKIAVPYHSVQYTSPSNHLRLKILIADSAAEPTWSAVELGEDPVYALSGSSADGNAISSCFYGHLRGLHVVFTGQALATLPRTANDEVDIARFRYSGGAAAGSIVLGSGVYISGVHVKPITGGLGILYSVNGTQVWFHKVELDFCTG